MKLVKKTFIINALYIAVAVALILCAWWAASAAVDSEFVVPSIDATFSAFKEVFENSEFWHGLVGTLLR
ncbi:MAG: hypothetical protein K2O39_03680, partial [Clostridiales bacterium]|nr:hypothetical protein [Clostridiales bacterium]